jgi:hypothetical protein
MTRGRMFDWRVENTASDPLRRRARRDRSRDPHLRKVRVFVRLGLAGPVKRGSVWPVSEESNANSVLIRMDARP